VRFFLYFEHHHPALGFSLVFCSLLLFFGVLGGGGCDVFVFGVFCFFLFFLFVCTLGFVWL